MHPAAVPLAIARCSSSNAADEIMAGNDELGNTLSAYHLGECYEYGKMGWPQDPAPSIHYHVRPRPSCAASPP